MSAEASTDPSRGAESGASLAPSAMQLSLALMLRESAARYPKRIAIVDGEQELSYRELWQEALTRAGTLRDELGVTPGDRVALVATNGLGFVAEYFAILAAGGVVVPMAPMLVADEVAFQLRDSEVRAVLAEPEFADVVQMAAQQAGVTARSIPDHRVSTGAEQRVTGGSEQQHTLTDLVPRQPLDPAVVFYTSGTTGRPKGAVLTHLNLVMNCFINAFLANRFETDDVVLGCLPLFHTFGQTVSMNSSFLLGAKVILQRRFDPAEALALMRRHSVNVMIGVPTMYMALLEALGDEPPVPLRMCVSGGAPLPVSVLERFEATFGCQIQEGYGLSETSPTATVNHEPFGLKPGSIGHPLWGIDVEIARAEVEDRIELLGTDELGEIVIRGHNAFAGYYGRPEATQAAVVDGWFRTGDLGTKDADGFRWVVDRKKDMILRGGYNVYPREIEEVLARHPAIAQVAVVGVPDERLGEEVLAAVVIDPSATAPTLNELSEWAAGRIARHKRPRIIRIVDELPIGPTRKVLKREIRARHEAGEL
jgi:long-chain acyl-CoA synthetase